MNLSKLFEIQRVLDERIYERFPDLKGKNNLDWKILALQVELGECANEWRGFKKWSEDRDPRSKVPITAWGEPYKNPLLEEFVDCLHFILSIGIELELEDTFVYPFKSNDKITYKFSRLMFQAHALTDHHKQPKSETEGTYGSMFSVFLGLGELLGFAWEEVETAYMAKNEINHKRQENGY